MTNQCKIVTDVQNTITILFKDALASIMFWLYMQKASTKDIEDHLNEIYIIDVSPRLVSKIIDEIIQFVTECKSRPLEKSTPIPEKPGDKYTQRTPSSRTSATVKGYKYQDSLPKRLCSSQNNLPRYHEHKQEMDNAYNVSVKVNTP